MSHDCYRCGATRRTERHMFIGRSKSTSTWLCFDCFTMVQKDLMQFSPKVAPPRSPVMVRLAEAGESAGGDDE